VVDHGASGLTDFPAPPDDAHGLLRSQLGYLVDVWIAGGAASATAADRREFERGQRLTCVVV